MAVTKRTRYEVLRRDNHTCRYCGGRAPDVVLTVDHVVPVALGGSDGPDNLVAACRDCNAGKASASPDGQTVAQVSLLAARWSAAMVVAVAEAEQRTDRLERFRDAFHFEWTHGAHEQTAPLPQGWEASVDRWSAAGLSPKLLEEAIRITMQGPARGVGKFRYLAGVVKRQLAQLTDDALDVVSQTAGEVPGGPAGRSEAWKAGYRVGWEAAERAERYWSADISQLGLTSTVLNPAGAS